MEKQSIDNTPERGGKNQAANQSMLKSEYMLLQKKFDRLESKERKLQVSLCLKKNNPNDQH